MTVIDLNYNKDEPIKDSGKDVYVHAVRHLTEKLLPELGEAELKLLLVFIEDLVLWGEINGEVLLSLRDLEVNTGLSRQGVVNGTNKLIELGIIAKHIDLDTRICSWNLREK